MIGFIKKIVKSFGINKKNLHLASLPFKVAWLKFFCVLPGGKSLKKTILAESAVMLEKKDMTLPQFDSVLRLYFKK
jgi:hypothetical protein